MEIVWILLGALLIIGVMYIQSLRSAKAQAEGTIETQKEAIEKADKVFFEGMGEERREDAKEAAAVTDDESALDFLRDSFRSR